MQKSFSIFIFILLMLIISNCTVNDIDKKEEKEIEQQTINNTEKDYVEVDISDALYIDALNGSDRNDGTSQRPFKTVKHLFETLKGGEVVVFKEGNYDGYTYSSGDLSNIFNSEVTFIAEEGSIVKIKAIQITNWQFDYELNLRIQNINLIDGIKFSNGSGLKLYNCEINRIGSCVGSEENMGKSAVYFRNISDLEIINCEITKAATGISGEGENIIIKNNKIHECSHDGIQMTGVVNALVEGNEIYHLDDGVYDDEASWSKHCDALHIYIKGAASAENLIPNENVTIRGNIIYGVEAQGIQFNTYYAFPEIRNKNIVIENNIFGPTGANSFNEGSTCDGLTIRNNSFIEIEGGYTFNSMNRELTCSNNTFRLTGDSSEVYIYNNVFQSYNGSAAAKNIKLFWNNIIENTAIDISCDLRFNYVIEGTVFENPENLDGIIKSDTIAVNGGTEIYANIPTYRYAINGVERDIRPDIGAYEIEGTNPEAEDELVVYNDEKFIFIDNFDDGNFKKDEWLNDVNTEGIAWEKVAISDQEYRINSHNDLESNAINGPTNTEDNRAMIVAENGSTWNDYKFSFKAGNAYISEGDGVIFLFQDMNNYFWLDVSKSSGRLIVQYEDEIGNPKSETLIENDLLKLPHGGIKSYMLSINNNETLILIDIDIDGNGIYDLSYEVEDSYIVSKFNSGTVGFYKNTASMYVTNVYDNIRVELNQN